MSDDTPDFSKFVMTKQTENFFMLRNANQVHGVLRVTEDGRLVFDGDVHESAKVFFEHVVAQHSEAVAKLKAENERLSGIVYDKSWQLGHTNNALDKTQEEMIKLKAENERLSVRIDDLENQILEMGERD